MSPDFVRVGTRLAALEMIESGTTTFADMYYFEDDIAEVTHEAGLRAVLGQSVIKFPVADAPTPEDGAGPRRRVHREVEERPARSRRRWRRTAPTRSSRPTLQAARALANKSRRAAADPPGRDPGRDQDHPGRARARRRRDSWTGSASGTADRSPRTPCGWTTRDMDVLAKAQVGLAHNPESNMKLASGVAAVPDWMTQRHARRAGHRRRRQQQRSRHVRGDAHGRAAAQGRDRQSAGDAGAAGAGAGHAPRRRRARTWATASAVSSRASRPTSSPSRWTARAQTPMFDPISHLVYVTRGDDVRTTIVGGRVLMRDRQVRSLKPR